jgi:hypothetical protein
MIRASQQGEKGRRLIEQPKKLLTLGSQSSLGQHLLRRLGAGDQHTAHSVRRSGVVDGAVAVGPVHLLQFAEANDGHALVFGPHGALTTHHLLDL